MKKRLWLVLLSIVLLGTIVGSTETYSKTITAWFYDIKVNVNGSSLTFTNSPFVYNGRTYVSINELSNFFGYDVQWNDQTKTISLTSSGNDAAISTLKYELDRKTQEINNLKLQIQQQDQQLSILKDPSYTGTDGRYTKDVLNELEGILDDDYYRHRNNSRYLYFQYALSQLNSGSIQLKMYGEFSRSSDYWTDRDKENFRDFILTICKEIDKKLDEDIVVYVLDKNDDVCADYTYIDTRNNISSYYEY